MTLPGGVSDWRTDNAEWLTLSLERLHLELTRRALWLRRDTPRAPRSADWLLTADSPALESRFHEGNAESSAIATAIGVLEARLADHERRMRTETRPPALCVLAEQARLDSLEKDLLLAAAAPALDGAFGQAFAELSDDGRRPYASLHLALGLFVEGATDRLLAADCLTPARPLRSLRLVDVDDDAGGPLLTRRLGVDERIADYLRGLNRPDARVVPFLSPVSAPLSTGSIDRLAQGITERVARDQGWSTVNLVGASDAGARELARSVCAGLGLDLLALDISKLAGSSEAERRTILALLGREAMLGGIALLVDTAGVEPRSPAAATVDEMIERAAATLFVISAERWTGLSEAHRTAHVIAVPRPTRLEQRVLWSAALATRPHSMNGELDAIVQQFDFGPGAIAETVERASRTVDEITARDLWRSCREQMGAGLAELAHRVTPSYGWDDIVVTDDVRAQLTELADQVALRARVYEGWGFGSQLGRGRGITALFAGPSGTGKTMAAEILARHLELDLYRIDLAGVVSKYIGETEKNLRRVFDAAERTGAILFFDEADALFGSRTEVRDSHDRYANVEVNYLLQRMEDYAGLAILATNRRTALDTAFIRRLRFVITFPVPGPDDRRRIWERVFPAQAELSDIQYGFLSRLEVTGGNIRSIAVNAAFLAAAEHKPVTMAHLIRAAAREYTKLSKPIGAGEFGTYYPVARP